MSFVAGDILIRMAADVASLRNDMNKAQGVVTDAFDKMKTAAKVLGGLFAVDQIASWTKASIDAADKIDELGQRIGMSAEEISRLGLAFQMAGVDSAGMQTALVKLSKNVVENEDAFTALGIKVRDSSGAYRASSEILADVSEFFSQLPDGVTKTALATELFGKAGADLIPVLNGGKKGLVDMAAEAERFGTVINNDAAKAAGDFNDALDLMRLKAQAVTVNGLGPILPVLTEIIRQFGQIGNATKDATGEIGFWQNAFMTAAEAVGVLLLNVVFVARAMAGEIAAIAKQLAALATLDFSEFTRIGDEWRTKAAAMRKEVDDQSAAILNARNKIKEHSSETESAVPKINAQTQAMAEAALKAKEKAAADKKAAEELEKLKKAGDDYLASLNQKLVVAREELALGRTLTEAEKEQYKLNEMLRDGKIKLTAAQAASARATIDLTQRTKDQAEAARKAKEETDKLTKAGDEYVSGLNKRLSVMSQELLLGRELTEGEKEEIRLTELLNEKKIILTATQEIEARQTIRMIQGIREEQAARRDMEQAMIAAAQHSTKLKDAQIEETESLRKSNVQLREQIESLSLSEREIVKREAAVLQARATDLEWQAATEGGNRQLEEQARLLRERAGLLEQGVAVKEAKAAAEEWAKVTKSIEDGLTDALMRGFESGKGFSDNIISYIKNAFKTLVANFIVRPIMAPISGAVGAVMSGNAFAGTGGGGGGGLMGFNPLSLLGNGLTNIGNTFAFGAESLGSFLVGNTTGSLNSLGGSLMANSGAIGTFGSYLGGAGIGIGLGSMLAGDYKLGGLSGTSSSAIGTAIGAAIGGPIGAAIGGVLGGVVNRAFGRGPKEVTEQGLLGSFTAGGATGQTFQEWVKKGGLFRSDKGGTDLSAMNKEIADALNAGAGAVFQQVKNYATALKLPGEALSNVTSQFRIRLTGKAEEDTAAITAALTAYETSLADQFAGALVPFQRAGETLIQTFSRLANLSQSTESLNQFGGVFSKLASSSIQARENVIALAGGIENLVAAAQRFVADYYTTEERAGLSARATIDALRSVGLSDATISSLNTKEEFRALVESLDLSNARGQEQLVKLLALAPQFAEMANYLEDNNLKLDELAKQAPAVAVLDQILPQTQTTAEAVQSVSEKIETSNARLQSIVDTVKEGNLSLSAGLQAIASASAAAAAAQAQANAIAAQNARALEELSGNASLASSAPHYEYNYGGGW